MLSKINEANKINERLIEQLSEMLPYQFEMTSLKFDLQYHADLKVTGIGGATEYWLMRFRKPPYKDFTIRTTAKKYKSEFEKLYNNQTISKRYLHIVLNQDDSIQEVYIINIARLSNMKPFLDYIYKKQRKQNFVYITAEQLFEYKLIDFYLFIGG